MKAIVILGLFLFAHVCREAHAQQLEGNWNIIAPPTPDELASATSTRPMWKLNEEGMHILASRFTREDREQRNHIAIPEHLVREPFMRDTPSVVHISGGGWLIGFNGGEFMGGLWSTNEDGSQTKKLLSMADIHALFRTTSGVIVLEGLAHATLDNGSVYFVPASSWATAGARKIADIHSSPEASVQETPEAVLVTTNKAVLRVGSTGTIETLFECKSFFSTELYSFGRPHDLCQFAWIHCSFASEFNWL